MMINTRNPTRFHRTGELSDMLAGFNYAGNEHLPERLIKALYDRNVVVCESRVLRLCPVYLADGLLYEQLMVSGKADIEDSIPALYVGKRFNPVYFDPEIGRRIGDDLGLYYWIKKNRQH